MTCPSKMNPWQIDAAVKVASSSSKTTFDFLSSQGYCFCPECALYWATAAMVHSFLEYQPNMTPGQINEVLMIGASAAHESYAKEQALKAQAQNGAAQNSPAAAPSAPGAAPSEAEEGSKDHFKGMKGRVN